MEEEIEDLIGDLKYSDSSKSVSLFEASPIYSYDFSDSSPDRHNSSDKETYVIEVDESLDSSMDEKHFELSQNIGSTNFLQQSSLSSCDPFLSNIKLMKRNTRTKVEQETFTQTSKTIIELAQNDGLITLKKDTESLHTQTSCISITKEIHYTIKVNEQNEIDLNDTRVITDYDNKVNSDSDSRQKDDTSDSYPSFNSDESPKELDNQQDKCWYNYNDASFYNRGAENAEKMDFNRFAEKRKHILSPVTEESTLKSIIDITPNEMLDSYSDISMNEITCSSEVTQHDTVKDFYLPQIKSNTPQPNLIFTLTQNVKPVMKSETLPCMYVSRNRNQKLESYVLACGENFNNDEHTTIKSDVHLPPINSNFKPKRPPPNLQIQKMFQNSQVTWECPPEPISIDEKIKELKINNSQNPDPVEKCIDSPNSICSELVERSCDALCADIIRRLKENTWTQVVETMETLPLALEKFWHVITELRIAELLRQVTSIVESPRTQVAKSACAALAVILQNTNYIKKPEFYEAMSILITKTGSFSHPVRRAANLALDHIVCSVETCHAVSAICIYGVSHKSGLVRCASARLLVVTVALAQGGRSLLRSRPSSAATARQHLLRSLSALLDDKNNETRRFAERLYKMLRPQKNFEAYFLNDVNLEIATRQMMKYDQLV